MLYDILIFKHIVHFNTQLLSLLTYKKEELSIFIHDTDFSSFFRFKALIESATQVVSTLHQIPDYIPRDNLP